MSKYVGEHKPYAEREIDYGFGEFFEGLQKNIFGMMASIWSGNPGWIVSQSVDLSKFITRIFINPGRDPL